MSTIQLLYLDETVSIEENDLILARKSGQVTDNRMKFSNLCKSIGNSSILGYKATINSQTENILTLNLSPVNNVPIPFTIVESNQHPDYPEGTFIFFTFPTDFKGTIYIKILEKTYTLVSSHDNSTYFSCKEGEYFIIKYTLINDRFSRVNDFDHIMFTNIYDVSNIETIPNDITIKLISTYGLQKQKYIKGMEILFTPSQTIVSNSIFISIDELGFNKPALRFADSALETTLVKNQEVRAVHDGTKFVIASNDYPRLLSNFEFTGSYNNNYLLNFKNTYYSNISTYSLTFTVDKDGNNNYLTINDAINDIEQRFGHNKQNLKIKLKIGSVVITNPIVIERDLSYIELNPLTSNEINLECNVATSVFSILRNGVFFSVLSNTIINLSNTQDTTFDFIYVHNNVFNSFENFSIILKSFFNFKTIGEVFRFTVAGGGIAMKNITVQDASFVANQGKYVIGIGLGMYSSNIYLNNVVLKHRSSDGQGLYINGKTYEQEATKYRPHRHNVFVINSDFSTNGTTSTADIKFNLEKKGYTILNQIDTKAGCNVTANTSSPNWGWYTRSGDGTTQGNL